MANEYVEVPSEGDRSSDTRRPSVRLFLLGRPNTVEATILELHTKHFGEAGLWSQPLQFPETQNQFVLSPGEVMRVYKRYLNQQARSGLH